MQLIDEISIPSPKASIFEIFLKILGGALFLLNSGFSQKFHFSFSKANSKTRAAHYDVHFDFLMLSIGK